jgi:DNA-binding transcriptional regulator YdaS (Cro superfamily)
MRLNQYLVQKEMTATAFAKQIGVSNVAVWKWLNRVSMPTGKHMVIVDRLTDGQVTSADWIIDEQDAAGQGLQD